MKDVKEEQLINKEEQLSTNSSILEFLKQQEEYRHQMYAFLNKEVFSVLEPSDWDRLTKSDDTLDTIFLKASREGARKLLREGRVL